LFNKNGLYIVLIVFTIESGKFRKALCVTAVLFVTTEKGHAVTGKAYLLNGKVYLLTGKAYLISGKACSVPGKAH
jgi:dolichyl-phosphate-mannose--protein O-mannosyl transferase